MVSAERRRSLWPNPQDQIEQKRQLVGDKLENRPKFNFSLNKAAKKENPRTLKMGSNFFNSTLQPFVPNVVSMQKNSSANFAAYVQKATVDEAKNQQFLKKQFHSILQKQPSQA